MKKITFLCFFICFFSELKSQIGPNSTYYLTGSSWDRDFESPRFEDIVYFYAPTKKRAENKVSQIKIIHVDKKKGNKEIIQHFNKAGKLISAKNPSFKYEYKAEYLNDTLLTYTFRKTKNKIIESKMTYENGMLKTKEKFYQGKKKFSQVNTYSTSKKILKSDVIDRKGKNRVMTYEYNTEGNLIKTTFSINGKVKNVWNYDCKPQGQQIKPQKEESLSSRCEYREESNDGSYIIFTRTITKETPYLNEQKFTKDSILFESNYYRNDSILIHNWKKDDSWEISTNYRKGKITYQYHNKYNNERKVVEYKWSNRNKCKYQYKNIYDKNGNLVERISFDNPRKLNPSSKQKYEVDENGLVLRNLYFYKGKQKNETLFEYTKF